jgi:hypothetical protein
LYVDLRNRNTVDYTFGDKPQVEGEVFRDKDCLVVRWGAVETTGNGMVWKDMGVVFVTSIVECRCDLDFEGEYTTDYLREVISRENDWSGGGWSDLNSAD